MRSRTNSVGVSSCSGDHGSAGVQVGTHMSREGAVAVVLVLHGVGTGEIGTGRHRHGSLCRRRCRHRRAVVRDLVAIGAGRACGSRPRHTVTSQGLCGGTRSILNRARVMVLVAGQGRAAGEGLLTVGVGALVRALARVYTTVPGQGTRVAEGLRMSISTGTRHSHMLGLVNSLCHSARTCVASLQCARAGERSRQNAG